MRNLLSVKYIAQWISKLKVPCFADYFIHSLIKTFFPWARVAGKLVLKITNRRTIKNIFFSTQSSLSYLEKYVFINCKWCNAFGVVIYNLFFLMTKVRTALHFSLGMYSSNTVGKVIINCSSYFVFLEIWRIIWLAQLSQGPSMDFQSWSACKY